MRPYSLDIRERIVAALDQGQTYRQVAQRFPISVPTVGRYRRLEKTNGTLKPKPLPGRKPALTPEEQEPLRHLLATRQDWTILTLQGAWQEQTGKRLSKSCLHQWMHRLGFSCKKRVAWQPNETARKMQTGGQPFKKP